MKYSVRDIRKIKKFVYSGIIALVLHLERRKSVINCRNNANTWLQLVHGGKQYLQCKCTPACCTFPDATEARLLLCAHTFNLQGWTDCSELRQYKNLELK
jgi:hypothetical protein